MPAREARDARTRPYDTHAPDLRPGLQIVPDQLVLVLKAELIVEQLEILIIHQHEVAPWQATPQTRRTCA